VFVCGDCQTFQRKRGKIGQQMQHHGNANVTQQSGKCACKYRKEILAQQYQ